jgi:hypothetical protein
MRTPRVATRVEISAVIRKRFKVSLYISIGRLFTLTIAKNCRWMVIKSRFKNAYLLVSIIPIIPPAVPHQRKLLIPQIHSTSVPKINAPNAQPRAKQNKRTPII